MRPGLVGGQRRLSADLVHIFALPILQKHLPHGEARQNLQHRQRLAAHLLCERCVGAAGHGYAHARVAAFKRKSEIQGDIQ